MPGDNGDLYTESLWDRLLSRQQDLIRDSYFTLSAEERESVFKHLVRMTNEPGWHEEQRISAQAALRAISDQ